MKIDTSCIHLTTQSQFSETTQSKREARFRFWEILDHETRLIADDTTHEEKQVTHTSHTIETTEFNNTDPRNHPLAFTRNMIRGNYLRNTAIDNLIVMGQELTDEQRSALSDTVREQLDWVDRIKETHLSFSVYNVRMKPDDLEPFQRSDSITDDIDTMVQWLEESNTCLAFLSECTDMAPNLRQPSGIRPDDDIRQQ